MSQYSEIIIVVVPPPKVLSLVSSSCASERNWSTFEFIHSKKRNRLGAKRCNDLVWAFSNSRLREKLRDPEYTEEMVEWGSDSESEEEASASQRELEDW
jgi:hypothetical protein